MFNGCSNLTYIYVGDSWDVSNVGNSEMMFNNCESIVGEDGTTYDANATDKSKAHYGTGGYLRYKKPTGIIDLNADVNMNDNRYYTIDGRRVEQPTQQGVYIVNGKKVVLK